MFYRLRLYCSLLMQDYSPHVEKEPVVGGIDKAAAAPKLALQL